MDPKIARLHNIRKRMEDDAKMIKTLVPPIHDTLVMGALALEEALNVIRRLDDPMVICPRSGLVAQAFEFGGRTESDCPECGKHFELEKGRFPPHTILESILTGRQARMDNY